jgi:Uma2 family endonuclease
MGCGAPPWPRPVTRQIRKRLHEIALTRYTCVVSTARRLHHSYDEYLRALDLSGVKLEYCDGEIYAMAGGTPAHADLAASMTRLLGNALLGRCRVSSSDLKVRIDVTDLTTFPDVTVVCGERRLAAIDSHAVTNPTVLVEVTSKSTEDYDRGEKLSHYKQLPSLLAVLFVSHRRPQVTVVERTQDGWTQREHRAGEHVVLQNPSLSISVDELYAGIELGDGH